MVVSDDGWVVLRTHGFHPEVIAVGVDGRDAVRVRVESETIDPPADPRPGPVWKLTHLVDSTAGRYWSPHSWRGFFRHQGRSVFAWPTSWGQRLILDLARSVAHTGEEPIPAGLEAAVVAAEQAGVRAFLARLSGQKEAVWGRLDLPWEEQRGMRDEIQDLMDRAPSALHLVGVHRMRDCIPALREWEFPDHPAGRTGTSAMPGDWWLEEQVFRPVVHHALKHLGEEPAGYPTYGFVRGYHPNLERCPTPSPIPDRLERAGGSVPEMSAADILGRIGSPEFVRRSSRKEDRVVVCSEDWEYDFRHGDG